MGGNNSKTHALYRNCTWLTFVDAIQEMNRNYRNILVENDEYLCFALRRDAYTSADHTAWKDSIEIICCKVNAKTKSVISVKTLDLKEFYNAYDLHKALMNNIQVPSDNMTRSQYIFEESSDIEGNCVICMENQNTILLPCLHSFCLRCTIAEYEYRKNNFTCPMCKTPCQRPIESSWEVPDVPSTDEVNDYLKQIGKN